MLSHTKTSSNKLVKLLHLFFDLFESNLEFCVFLIVVLPSSSPLDAWIFSLHSVA